MDGMFLGLAALFRDIFSETTDSPPIELTTSTSTTSSPLSTTTNCTNATVAVYDEMHHTTATGLVVTALLVVIVVACIVLCFMLRKYCRCAYDLRYSLNYGKAPRGSVPVPTEDTMESGDLKKPPYNAEPGVNSRHPSQTRLTQSRPPTPGQQRPPRPPPATRSPASEHRPLLEKEGGADPKGSLAVQPTGLYPVNETSPFIDDSKLERHD